LTLETVALALGTLLGALGFVLEWRRRGVEAHRFAELETRVGSLESAVADHRAWRDRLNRAA
jgi:hypothetical protein